MSYKIEITQTFEKNAKKLAKKYPSLKDDLAQLVESLSANPNQGTSLGNNFYKIRLNIISKGKGKSGGARVITCLLITKETIYLSAIYDKSEKSSISAKELNALAKIISKM